MYFSRKQQFEVENVLEMNFFIANPQVFTSQNWIHVDYSDVFISGLNSHSDGTHSL